MRMQRLTSESHRKWGDVFGSINGVPHDWMANSGQMDADLVRAAGLETAFQHGGRVSKSLHDSEMRHCLCAPAGCPADAAPPVPPIHDERQINRPSRIADRALDDRQISAVDRMRAEERLEWSQGPGRTHEQHNA